MYCLIEKTEINEKRPELAHLKIVLKQAYLYC